MSLEIYRDIVLGISYNIPSSWEVNKAVESNPAHIIGLLNLQVIIFMSMSQSSVKLV